MLSGCVCACMRDSISCSCLRVSDSHGLGDPPGGRCTNTQTINTHTGSVTTSFRCLSCSLSTAQRAAPSDKICYSYTPPLKSSAEPKIDMWCYLEKKCACFICSGRCCSFRFHSILICYGPNFGLSNMGLV